MSEPFFDELLPLPPSVNRYWRKGKTWGGKNIIRLSDEAVTFTQAVAIIVAKKAKNKCSQKRLRGEFVVHPATKAKQDIDNRLKGLLDAMQKSFLYLDDEQFDEITIKRGSVIKGGCIAVKVWEIEQ